MASGLYEDFEWHPKITKHFKSFCRKCKHHSFLADSEDITTYHNCDLLNHPMWIDSKYDSDQISIKEEECPMYLEYTLGMKNESE